MRSGLGQNLKSKFTLAEMRQVVSISAAINNQWQWRRTDLNQAKNAYKPVGTGLSLLARSLYFTVQQSSLESGFDIEQVNFIWRTASLAYSVKEIYSMFKGILEKMTSTRIYHHYLRDDLLLLPSVSNLPTGIIEGKGAGAIRTLAHLKIQRDQRAFIWTSEIDWNDPVVSWVDFTYALLEKLVKDDLVTDTLRCKLFARDLGL